MLAVPALLSACGSGDSDTTRTASPSPTPAGYLGMVVTPAMPKPEFTLTDTSGQPFNFVAETEGYLTYLYFGYTYCPDICPSHMADIAAVIKRQPELNQKVKVVFVTVDPDRDTPDRLRAWLDLFDEDFIGLRGDAADLEAATKAALGELWFPIEKSTPADGGEGYIMSHAAFVQLYTLDNLSHIVYPFGVPQSGYEWDLTKLIKEGWTES
ncbi:MAG TPA: SCO family protein [Dehalococcoidia bacterium]|nr:SCO family protein [Dehalococcoidia bacterium]